MLSLEPVRRLMPRTDETDSPGQLSIKLRQTSFRPFRGPQIGAPKIELELPAETFRKPLRSQRPIPVRRLDPRACAREQIVRHDAGRGTYPQRNRLFHLPAIGKERRPVAGQRSRRQSEQG